ncbi:MAG: lytic transglycosylase domain-containing protein [Polaromonas sp.]
MKRIALIGAAGLLAYGAWLMYQQSQTADSGCDTCNTVNDALDNLMNTTRNALGLWHPPAQYAGTIAATEDRYGIPRDILARLLYQESRYRADIISGATSSPVGALGIAQFMPATAAEMGIDPLNPTQAIDGAGRYLSQLYQRLGGWSEALAAYNWGIGNVQRKGIAAAPRETRLYYSQILADVNSTNGTAYA